MGRKTPLSNINHMGKKTHFSNINNTGRGAIKKEPEKNIPKGMLKI